MKSNHYLMLGASIVAAATLASATTGASARLIYLPHHNGGAAPPPINLPDGPHKARYVAPRNHSSGAWVEVNNEPFTGNGAWGPLLLTDGSVIMKQAFTGTTGIWYKLTPDKKNFYTTGTWTKIAPMPSGYQPDFYASQVLPDGNVLIEGGEYNGGTEDHTNKGAIYNPVTNTWTSVSAPTGWTEIGDAESIILPDGSYMLANCCDSGPAEQAIASVSGTKVSWTTSDSYHYNNEQGYTPLPDGNVLMVDVWNIGSNFDDYEIYDTSTGTWSLAGQTADLLTSTKTRELGAAPLTPEGPAGGTIIQLTANQSPGINDIYSVAGGTWRPGPVLKVGTTVYDMADAPAATLPDGNILAEASPGYGATPAHFWEFNVGSTGKVTATQVNDTMTSPGSSDFGGNLLTLPTGTVLWDDSQYSTEIAIYRPNGSPKSAWLPVVSSVNKTLTVGSKGNAISGRNFNGFDLGGAYGDDSQQATNYPIVRFKNNATGDYCYARSYNFSTMGVWTTGTTNATFDIPSSCETGASQLQVILNGIASNGVSVTLKT